MDMLGAACVILLVGMIYFLLKFIVTSNALSAYMFWVESKGIKHPSQQEFDVCRKEVIRQRFKRA